MTLFVEKLVQNDGSWDCQCLCGEIIPVTTNWENLSEHCGKEHLDLRSHFARCLASQSTSLTRASNSVTQKDFEALCLRNQLLQVQVAKLHSQLVALAGEYANLLPHQFVGQRQIDSSSSSESESELLLLASAAHSQQIEAERRIEALNLSVLGLARNFADSVHADEFSREARALNRFQQTPDTSVFIDFIAASLRNLDSRSSLQHRYPLPVLFLWLLMFNYGKEHVYRIWAQNLGGPNFDYVRRLSDSTVVDPGIHQHMCDDAAVYYTRIGVDIGRTPFQLCFDATRLVDIVQYDGRRRAVIGYVTALPLPFDDWEQAQAAHGRLEVAKFVNVFLITPLDPNLPSVYRLVAVIAQPGKYPASQCHEWLRDARTCARRAGFEHVVVAGADGDSRHRKLALQLMRTEEGRRFVGGELGRLFNLYPIFEDGKWWLLATDTTHLVKKVLSHSFTVNLTCVSGTVQFDFNEQHFGYGQRSCTINASSRRSFNLWRRFTRTGSQWCRSTEL